MKTKLKFDGLLMVGLLALSSLSFAADWAPGSTDWDKLPEVKKSKIGLYLTPQQAYDMKKKDPQPMPCKNTTIAV